jgi:hypothetical protein
MDAESIRYVMRRTIGIAVVAAALLAGCGSGGSSDGKIKRAGNRDSYVLTPKQRRDVARQQAAHSGRADPSLGHAGVLSRLERSILVDARARVRAKELEGPIRRVTCEVTRRDDNVFSCTAVTDELEAADKDPDNAVVTGVTGHPFRAVVDFPAGRYWWCKRILVPGEGGVIDPRAMVPLPRECNP